MQIGIKNPARISTLSCDADLDNGTYGVKGCLTNNNYLYSASDTLRASSDDIVELTTPAVYTDTGKRITVPAGVQANSTLRIKFDICTALAYGTCLGRIYRNGVAVGTAQSTGYHDPSYQTFSQDIAGWSPGDTVELYGKWESESFNIKLKNLRVYGTATVGVISGGAPSW